MNKLFLSTLMCFIFLFVIVSLYAVLHQYVDYGYFDPWDSVPFLSDKLSKISSLKFYTNFTNFSYSIDKLKNFGASGDILSLFKGLISLATSIIIIPVNLIRDLFSILQVLF